MVQRAQLTRLPLKHGLLIVGRAADDRRTEMIIHHLHRRNLHIRAHVVSEAQRSKRIHAILLVQVRSRRNRILRRVRRRAVTRRNRVVLVVVVTHHTRHGGKIVHLVVITSEYLRSRTHLPRHRLRFPLHHLRGITTLVVDILEVRDVVRRPVCRLAQPLRHITTMTTARNLFINVERAVAKRLERRELVVVEHHPLVVVQTAVVERVPRHPLLRRRRQTVRQRRSRPLQHALRFDILVQRLVPNGNRGFLDGETRGGDVEIVAGGEAAGVG